MNYAQVHYTRGSRTVEAWFDLRTSSGQHAKNTILNDDENDIHYITYHKSMGSNPTATRFSTKFA